MLSKAPEYDVRELGPWARHSVGSYFTKDPYQGGGWIWWTRADGFYSRTNGSSSYSRIPIYFEGAGMHRGRPLQQDEAEVGTPEEQWERGLPEDLVGPVQAPIRGGNGASSSAP